MAQQVEGQQMLEQFGVTAIDAKDVEENIIAEVIIRTPPPPPPAAVPCQYLNQGSRTLK